MIKKQLTNSAGLLLLAVTLKAHSIQLHFPVACTLNTDCYIQHYVDVDPTYLARDYTGGRLTYNTHNGTDIAIATYDEMDAGVNVLAAADGKVLRTRDGEPNRMRGEAEDVTIRQCGNGIVIQHDAGYETQYCHLKPFSLLVHPGEKVKAGQAIAEIGASGRSDFPHVHFIVRKDAMLVEPFEQNLWQKPINYKATGLIAMGTSDKAVSNKSVLNTTLIKKTLHKHKQLVGWVRLYGTHIGDKQRFVFIQPNGKPYQDPIQQTFTKNSIEWFSYAGYKPPKPHGFTEGNWRIDYYYQSKDNPWVKFGSISFKVSA